MYQIKWDSATEEDNNQGFKITIRSGELSDVFIIADTNYCSESTPIELLGQK